MELQRSGRLVRKMGHGVGPMTADAGCGQGTEMHFKSHKQLHLTVVIINSVFSLYSLMLC